MRRRILCILCFAAPLALAQQHTRARDLGVPYDGAPGANNAITDVAGVEVGYKTLISGDGRLVIGKGPVRTGVTAILPRGKANGAAVFAGFFRGNGNGDMTGTHWIDESGILETPILITNTLSVGVVRDAAVNWMTAHKRPGYFWYPVVAETADVPLNDIKGQHVTAQDALDALDSAHGGAIAEGNVGGGTGMVCNGFKGGSGTASRIVAIGDQKYTVGVFVQCNYGGRQELRIAGIPVGREIKAPGICVAGELTPAPEFVAKFEIPPCGKTVASSQFNFPGGTQERGSIIVIVATDAPLTPDQLQRIARRVPLGLARAGSIEGDSSGDLFLSFSTATTGVDQGNSNEWSGTPVSSIQRLTSDAMNPLFLATIQSTDEAVDNAMIAAETMTGADNIRVTALPHDQLRQVLKAHNMLAPAVASH